ncbi:MAG: DinB family protein [Bacteroidota bacterium]
MKKTIDEFKLLIEQASISLTRISESESKSKSAPDKWSKKEILGHLIDSAANNHQRFVRAQLSANLKLPGYEQQAWVGAQQYQNESWANLFQFWKSYNLHLLHIISLIPERVLGNYCSIGSDEPVTLEFLIQDYVAHLRHHLEQILK